MVENLLHVMAEVSTKTPDFVLYFQVAVFASKDTLDHVVIDLVPKVFMV